MIKSTFTFDFPISEGHVIPKSTFAVAPKVVEGVLHDLPEAEEGVDILVSAIVLTHAPADRLDLIASDHETTVKDPETGRAAFHRSWIRKDQTKGLF